MDTPLVDLGKLTKPLTKLIEVVSSGVGTVYAPWGTVRQAKADAKAKKIHAKADIEVERLWERAQSRLRHVETRRQANLECIAEEAKKALPDAVSEKPVDEDWILQFFETAKDVCDAEMQKVWARILAGEVASPQTYSRRTLQFLKTMDTDEAIAFVKYCGFAFADPQGWPFVFSDPVTSDEMRKSFDTDYPFHFKDIGLVADDDIRQLSAWNGQTLTYFSRKFKVKAPPPPADGMLEKVYGYAALTQIGYELSRIVGAGPVPGYVERLIEGLAADLGITLSPAA